ncbi:histidine phosphatase family protein [Promineifilum sp.]|uniref:histidine phosphatase family protein n=1 Tax=Promineifilum sp. TaxID=2664178 RepID=UPI0035ADB3BC
MRLYILRHATPDYAADALTPAGHAEARALAGRLAGEGLTDLYSSPMGRARQTMQYTADLTGLPCAVEEWPAELMDVRADDPFLSRPPHVFDLSGELLRRHAPLPMLDNWHTFPPYDFPEVRARVEAIQAGSDDFLARHGYVRDGGLYRIERPNRRRLAVFCHNGAGLAWLAHLLAVPVSLMWVGFYLHPASITTVLFDERNERYATPRCLGLGDVGHLVAAGLALNPVGIKANYE